MKTIHLQVKDFITDDVHFDAMVREIDGDKVTCDYSDHIRSDLRGVFSMAHLSKMKVFRDGYRVRPAALNLTNDELMAELTA